ncbi:hypothetical protein Scep_009913 [Stephania cephalantha]|uniref:Uncharacterized protein n=1 Tax=Stephania cephalantha TaxID=152367 RepID=A0AAP0JU42_9MAGN
MSSCDSSNSASREREITRRLRNGLCHIRRSILSWGLKTNHSRLSHMKPWRTVQMFGGTP